MNESGNIELFERTPVPKAVMKMAFPNVLSCLVMVIYNMVDTYFVGMLNSPTESAAVALAALVLLAFNAVNNLFGVGSSSMMSRCLGKKDYDMVRRSSAFGFYCALIGGILFAALFTLFRSPLLTVLRGGRQREYESNRRISEMDSYLWGSSCNPECGS